MPETLVSIQPAGELAQLRRVIICAGTGCMANGAMKVFERFKTEMAGSGLSVILELRPEAGDGEVRLSKSGCQGFCQMGPLVSVLPDGILYTKVKAEDVPEIVTRTLMAGEAVDRLLYRDPATRKACRGLEENPFYARQNRNRSARPFSTPACAAAAAAGSRPAASGKRRACRSRPRNTSSATATKATPARS